MLTSSVRPLLGARKKEPALKRVKEQELGKTCPNSPLTSVALGTPVSCSDLYRRIFLDSPSTPNIPTKRVRPGEADTPSMSVLDDLNCSEHFVGDLSVILDEIMSNHRPEEDQGAKITNSTQIEPGCANEIVEKVEDLEDTFDRMCQ